MITMKYVSEFYLDSPSSQMIDGVCFFFFFFTFETLFNSMMNKFLFPLFLILFIRCNAYKWCNSVRKYISLSITDTFVVGFMLNIGGKKKQTFLSANVSGASVQISIFASGMQVRRCQATIEVGSKRF